MWRTYRETVMPLKKLVLIFLFIAFFPIYGYGDSGPESGVIPAGKYLIEYRLRAPIHQMSQLEWDAREVLDISSGAQRCGKYFYLTPREVSGKEDAIGIVARLREGLQRFEDGAVVQHPTFAVPTLVVGRMILVNEEVASEFLFCVNMLKDRRFRNKFTEAPTKSGLFSLTTIRSGAFL
jgi:hypothetical protein